MLLDACIGWASAANLQRLELTVHADNLAAQALYRSRGFAQEGIRRKSLRIDDRPVDEICMALLDF